jgi:endonuclease YncB( thermonuclease family)
LVAQRRAEQPFPHRRESATPLSMFPHARFCPGWFSLWALVLVVYLPVVSFARDAASVVKVVDGDTLDVRLNGRTESVRLIGVDTPEKFESDKLRRDVQRTGKEAAMHGPQDDPKEEKDALQYGWR